MVGRLLAPSQVHPFPGQHTSRSADTHTTAEDNPWGPPRFRRSSHLRDAANVCGTDHRDHRNLTSTGITGCRPALSPRWTPLLSPGRRSMPPSCWCPDRRQYRKPWRERPRLAPCISSRACPEGSLTPWQSVPMSLSSEASTVVSGRRRRCRRCCGKFRSGCSARSWRVCVGKTGPRARSEDAHPPHPPALTRSWLPLFSAPSRRVASLRPPESTAASALTAPARRSCPGSYVMASDYRCYQGGVVRTRTRTVDC